MKFSEYLTKELTPKSCKHGDVECFECIFLSKRSTKVMIRNAHLNKLIADCEAD